MRIKKYFYIASFTFLGILLSFLVHSILEILAIGFLVSDFDKWGLGLSWNVWIYTHHILSVFLFFAGVIFGFKQGKRWWRVLYVDKTN